MAYPEHDTLNISPISLFVQNLYHIKNIQ